MRFVNKARFQAQRWILGQDNETVASGLLFQRYRAPSWELCTIV